MVGSEGRERGRQCHGVGGLSQKQRPREELSTGNVFSILAFFCPAAQNGAWKTLGIESSGKNTFTLAKEPRSSLLSRFTFSRNSPFHHHVLEFLVIVFIPRNWKSRALSFQNGLSCCHTRPGGCHSFRDFFVPLPTPALYPTHTSRKLQAYSGREHAATCLLGN